MTHGPWRRLAALIESQSTLVLSTAGADGPHGAPLFYVPDGDLRLCWLSSPRSRHSLDLAAHSEAAKDPSRWRGLNLLGFALMEVRERLR